MFCLNENNINHLYSQGIDIRTYQYSPTNEVYVFANMVWVYQRVQ